MSVPYILSLYSSLVTLALDTLALNKDSTMVLRTPESHGENWIENSVWSILPAGQ